MTTTARVPDWEVGPISYPASKKAGLALVLAGPVVLFGIGMALLGGGLTVALLALTLGWIAFLVVNQWRANQSSALRGLTVVALHDARFQNLVDGLSEKIGLDPPELLLIEQGGPNAIVFRRPRTRMAVTRSLLDSFSRTEQEAVAAHCLLRLATGPIGIAQLAAALGRSGSRYAPRVGYEDDVHAAALTRYPPALASAITKSEPAGGPAAPLWFVAHDPSHRDPTERVAALDDL